MGCHSNIIEIKKFLDQLEQYILANSNRKSKSHEIEDSFTWLANSCDLNNFQIIQKSNLSNLGSIEIGREIEKKNLDFH